MSFRRRARLLPVLFAGALCLLLVCAPAAGAAARGAGVPPGFLGLPSLHEIIESIAKDFFSALAGALVPSWLKHGTVATIQHLVALPDPASWGHVSELEGDMTYLGMSLMPVTLAVCTMRYWMMGLTGSAHPASALVRCACATGVLVIYRWLVEQAVAATNTITHAILGFPVVANGLASIITVLFGGALLIGAGGVFGAFLVIVGVIFAAALFACGEALTVLLAVVFCAGPPFIALAPIPELSHLARAWSHALAAIVLVPIGWTILFAVAGALTLDATSVTHGAGGLPGHVAAAFAGLITFILAVKLPLMLFGELRHILGGALHTSNGGGGSHGASSVPGADRVRAAHARLRSVAFEGVPSFGGSAGRAVGALGAPEGGPLGAARRGLAGAAARSGVMSRIAPVSAARARMRGAAAGAAAGGRGGSGRGGVRERVARARRILADAPREAAVRMAGTPVGVREAARATRATGSVGAGKSPRNHSRADKGASAPKQAARARTAGGGRAAAAAGGSPGSRTPPQPRPQPRSKAPSQRPAGSDAAAPPAQADSGSEGKVHPGRRVTGSAEREASARAQPAQSPPGSVQPSPRSPQKPSPAKSRPAPPSPPRRPSPNRRPRPWSKR